MVFLLCTLKHEFIYVVVYFQCDDAEGDEQDSLCLFYYSSQERNILIDWNDLKIQTRLKKYRCIEKMQVGMLNIPAL